MPRTKKVHGIEWRWNETDYCYDGVHTFEGKLVWFTHYGNPHAGGGALTQSFESFLEKGPNISHAPQSILNEVRKFLLENLYSEKIPDKYSSNDSSLFAENGKIISFEEKGPLKTFNFYLGYDGEYEFSITFYEDYIHWFLEFDEQWSDPDREAIQSIDDFLRKGPPSGFELLENDSVLKNFALGLKKTDK
jgi:hypothetical protein